jgi:hypothetical protein
MAARYSAWTPVIRTSIRLVRIDVESGAISTLLVPRREIHIAADRQ